jgi:dihydroxyacetone kinase
MKKFINRSEDVVEEMLQGLAVLYPGCNRLSGHKVLGRADADQVRDRQVAVISGGGSGHEPAHAGYVGAGMLSAAVAGEVFTSPGTESVLAAIRGVSGEPGALLVVKNYTGDRLNFGLAAEIARSEGIPAEMIIVDDDVALKGTDHATGARGLAGTVLIHKLVGAAAAEGRDLSEVAAIGRAAVASLATMGVSFSAGTAPAVGRPGFELGEREMELGLGIHGEPGVKRTELQSADQIAETLLTHILQHGSFGEERRIAVMVNNLGATTEMELAILARRAVLSLGEKGFTVERVYAGTFLSSLDMAGISITVLGVNDQRIQWLDARTSAPAWPNAPKRPPGKAEERRVAEVSVHGVSPGGTGSLSMAESRTGQAIEAACNALIAAEATLTELDRITGDGDLGVSMTRTARAVLSSLHSLPDDNLSHTLHELSLTLSRELGGSSGPLYGVLFLRCASVLRNRDAIGPAQWAEAVAEGCAAISTLGGATPGDRTMLDALDPFAKKLNEQAGRAAPKEAVMAAVAAAEQGADATARMKPRLGRSSYLGERVLGYPDPGAKAVALWLRACCETVLAS